MKMETPFFCEKYIQRQGASAGDRRRRADGGVGRPGYYHTRHERPVAHVISDERLSALLETLDLAANPNT